MDQQGRHYRFKKLNFWAERGMINIIDERYPDNDCRSFEVVMITEWLHRLKALNGEIHRWNKWPDERNQMANFIEDAIKCAKEAKSQGRPDDPKAVADVLKTRRRTWAAGNGTSTVLHTAAASCTPENALLPPIPNHPDIEAEKNQ